MNLRRLSVAILIADLGWSIVAMIGALSLRYGTHWNLVETNAASQLFPFLEATWLIWAVLSLALPLDGFGGGWRLSAVASQLLLAVGALMLILLSGGYLVRSYVSRLALIQFSMLLLAGFFALRIASYVFLRAQLRNGAARRVVILGSGPLACELARKFDRHPEMLYRVVGLLAPDNGNADSRSAMDGACSTTTLGVIDLLTAQRTDEVILVSDECASPDLLNLAALCRDRGIGVNLVPQFYELYFSRFRLTDLDGLPVLQVARLGPSIPARVAKRVLDLVLGIPLLLAAVPVLIPLAVILRRAKGKAFRWEMRCGSQGKPFSMLRLNVDRGACNGSRLVTILHEFSLTELPQLWNVVRGEMSLVGPRPESRDRVCRYSEWQRRRLTVKPGMTGLAQVQGLREQHSSEEKTRFDLQYLLNFSVWTDLSLLLQTVWTLATRPAAPRRDCNTDVVLPEPMDEFVAPSAEKDILQDAHRP